MTDLVIGARRPSTPRPLRTLLIALLLLAVAGLVAYFIFRRVVSYPVPDGEAPDEAVRAHLEDRARLGFAGSELSHSGTIPVLRLVGDPHTLGVARGRLLGEALAPPTAALARTISETAPQEGFFSGLTHPLRIRWRYRLLDDGMPGHQLVEIGGLARGGQGLPDYEDLVRSQAAIDVGRPAPFSPGEGARSISRALSFAAPMRGPAGDRLLVGRSFGLPGAGGAGAPAPPLVAFVHPEGVIPFAAVGAAGQLGVVSGVNAEGIAIMVHPASADDVQVTREADPVALIARDVLENARSLEDAIGVLEHAEPLGAAAFLVASGNERRFAVVERSPGRKAVIRDPDDPTLSDLLGGKPFLDDAENDRAGRTRPSRMRQERVRELLRGGALEAPKEAVEILRDRRGPKGRGLPLGHRGAPEDLSADHTAVFDLSAMVLWVSEGPGASGRFRAFDLRHELGGEGRRPAPPPDVLADETVDPAAARNVLAARAVLAEARRAHLRGAEGRSREMVARALERAPDLPEALLLAGDYARADGDRDLARRYYLRYLDVGPDDLGAAEQVRARLEDLGAAP